MPLTGLAIALPGPKAPETAEDRALAASRLEEKELVEKASAAIDSPLKSWFTATTATSSGWP
jgi:hypothetical protein